MLLLFPPSHITNLASHYVPAYTLHSKRSGLLTLESALCPKASVFQSSETQIKGHLQQPLPSLILQYPLSLYPS